MLVLMFVVAAVAGVRGLWSPCGLSMLSALNPVSERARGHRFWVTVCWYLGGAVVGGGLLGAVCAVGAFGFGRLDAPAKFTWTVALVGAAVAALSDARVGGWSLPDHPRQVNVRWLTAYRRWIYAGGYGVQIGTGVATYVMSAAVYLTALLGVLSGSPAVALAGGVAFGLVRGLALLAAAPARDPERLGTVLARVDSWSAPSALLAWASCVATALVAAWTVGGAVAASGVLLVLVALGASSRKSAHGSRKSLAFDTPSVFTCVSTERTTRRWGSPRPSGRS